MIFHLSSGRRLDGIAVTTPPAKTSYYAGESFDTTGMVVTGTYNGSFTEQVTGYTVSPSGALAAGTASVTITYSEGGVTKTATQAITVTKQTVQVPTQTGSLTYNGSTQSPTWSNTAHINFSGDTSAANAGTYHPTAALADTALYQWPDGKTENKTLSWSIGKATGSASASPSSVTLSSSATTATVAVTRAGDGAITASSSNTSVCTVSVSGTTVTITGLASGTATVTINVAEGTNYTAASTSVGVSATFGVQIGTLAVGSTVKMNVNGVSKEFLVTHQGLPSSIYDSSCNGTWLLMKDIYENRAWHSSNVNDYANSTIHSYLNSTFLSLLDADIQAQVKQVKLPYRSGSGYGTTVTSGSSGLSAKIFLLSGTEVGFSSSGAYTPVNEGAKLSYFNSGDSSDTKRVAKLNGTAVCWWLRSPYCNIIYGATNALNVGTNGNWNYYNCSLTGCAIRPALILPSTATVDSEGNVLAA